MPRRKGIPSYLLHKPSGQARVRIDGQDCYLGPYDSPESKAEYERIVRRTMADRTQQALERSVERATDITISEILVRYHRHVESYYVKNGQATGQVAIIKPALKVVREKFGHLEARAFGPRALKACRAAYIAQGLCRKEVNRRTALVRQFFKWAVEDELIPALVWHGLRAVSGLRKDRNEAPEREPVGPAPKGVVEAILPYVRRTVAAMVRLQMLTGMRPAEVIRMRGRCLVTSEEVCDLCRAGSGTGTRGDGEARLTSPAGRILTNRPLRWGEIFCDRSQC